MGQKTPFDPENTAILLYKKGQDVWEEKSASINALYSAFFYGKFTGYDIYFKGTSGKFFYPYEKVRFLTKLHGIDFSKSDVYVDGKLIDPLKVDRFESDYYRISCRNVVYFSNNVVFKSNKHRDIYAYFSKLAEYAEQIAEKESPLYFLAKNYRRITPFKQSVLFDYFKGECRPAYDHDLILVPFEFNQSQVTAIDKAFHSNISVIEGPPGTGKTQTILNLIANILHRNLNCAVVSNNNAAIENVRQKLEEEKWSFLAASLGNFNHVNQFFETNGNEELEQFLSSPSSLSPYSTSEFNKHSITIKKIQEVEVENAQLQMLLNELHTEMKHYETFSFPKLRMNPKLGSEDYLLLMTRIQKNRKIRLFGKWLLSLKFKIKFSSFGLDVLLSNAEWMFYAQKVKETIRKMEQNKKFIVINNRDQTLQKLRSLSRDIITNDIKHRFSGKDIKSFEKESYKRDFTNFLERYPVILSTSQSLLNNIPQNFVFDYLIIDEASQGDLLSSVLAMSCAKNLVVVGDSRQLQQIDEERLFEESCRLAQEYEVPLYFRYEANSILKSVKEALPKVPTTLLREHYRCAPDIIHFCNQMFYNGELVPMTQNSGRHIEIIKTVPGNHARRNPFGTGLYNQREIDEIGKIIEASTSKEIGVISPFRYQANLLSQKYPNKNIEADTVHKFQGRQKEEVILSFVVNSLEKSTEIVENRLYDFVTNEKLFNVALSRGKTKVTLVVADKVYHSTNNVVNDFIKYSEYLYGNSVTQEAKVTSVFDLLYSEYTSKLLSLYKNNPGEHLSELLMGDLIREVIPKYKPICFSMHTRLSKLVVAPEGFTDDEKKYIFHPWTHVDFLFFNQISKETLFVLELDGVQYHEQNKKQSEHDAIKNRILAANHIPVYRFKTNESDERERLSAILNQYSR